MTGRSLIGPFCCAVLTGLLFSGCVSGDVGVQKVSPDRRSEYSSTMMRGYDGLMPGSVNVLGNFLLNDLYRDEPARLLEKLEKLYGAEPKGIYIETLADCALNLGLRFKSDPDVAIRYYLSAVLYATWYISRVDSTESVYDPARLGMIRVYNLALTELFACLSERKLEHNGGFELTAAAGQTVFFDPPEYRLAGNVGRKSSFLLCADYRPINLTHESHRFGIGVPLIVVLDRKERPEGETFAENIVLPATLVLAFGKYVPGQRCRARLIFADSRNSDDIVLGDRKIPLEQDLSTPLAYMAKDPPPFNFLFYMIRPEETRRMQGLYRFEAFDPGRIPVVLVHGLMSDTRTWLQMINTLRSDQEILKKYQIYGFSYSSGNPVLLSSEFLRVSLRQERERIVKAGLSTENFDRMVLVGHSMGGLLSRLAVSGSGDVFEKLITENGKYPLEELLKELSEEDRKVLRQFIRFEPLPFVKRVVFIAVPHRGSAMARSWIGRFGARLIRLPRRLISFRRTKFFRRFLRVIGKSDGYSGTGIDSLDPDNEAILFINSLKMAENVPVHSIIGNLREAGCPGGSDGIVPYSSSHLDQAQSELVVKSGHSAQKNPLAIQELRRILLLHLKECAPAEKTKK